MIGGAFPILLAVVFALLGFMLPDVVVSFKARGRRDQIKAAMPDALDLLAVSVEAGLGFDAAIQKLTEHMEGPLIEEFALGRILRVQATDTRNRRQAAAEEKAMKAPIKMLFPTALFIFPAMFIVILGPAFLNFRGIFF